MSIIELRDITKTYGAFTALNGVNLTVDEGTVTCVLGDNGAGKSTLIKTLAGLHPPTSGKILVDNKPTVFGSPRDALNAGIATVWRNFFLGNELTTNLGLLRDEEMKTITSNQLHDMGIDLPNVDVEVGQLSGGQRQVVSIARAVHFGARVIVLDEPTAALGVKQSGMVLRFIAAARERGVGVVLITHNPHHAYLVGDHFTILNLGRQVLDADRDEVSLAALTQQMAGGSELEALSHELWE